MNELVHRSTDHGVATITLDSPANRNALSAQLLRELRAQLTESTHDDAARVIVLDHTGPVFCAGMDIKEARSGVTDSQADNFPALLEQLWSSPKPVVAKLAGPARAGGIGIVAACDIAVAAEGATFAFSEVRIGVVPAMISVTVLPRLDPRQAHELFLTGETFDAQRAARIGLINSAVPADRLDEEVTRYADMLALGGPGALAATKALLAGRRAAEMHEEFARMRALSAEHFAGEEGREGMRAFAEKRKPHWVPEPSKQAD
jgi:methylglutaconyl-CoA hydratase